MMIRIKQIKSRSSLDAVTPLLGSKRSQIKYVNTSLISRFKENHHKHSIIALNANEKELVFIKSISLGSNMSNRLNIIKTPSLKNKFLIGLLTVRFNNKLNVTMATKSPKASAHMFNISVKPMNKNNFK